MDKVATVTVKLGDDTIFEGSYESCCIEHSRKIDTVFLGDRPIGLETVNGSEKTVITLSEKINGKQTDGTPE